METTTETSVERELAIDASPETVWQFLVEADKLDRWFGNQAWLDPRPGGRVHDGNLTPAVACAALPPGSATARVPG